MANYKAIMSVCNTVINLLRSKSQTVNFNNVQIEFKVFQMEDFFNPPFETGISLFLYRVYIDGVNRLPPGQITPTGRTGKNKLPLALHFLLTVWGKDISMQHTLAGWMMRVMEDTPLFPASLLNAEEADVFAPDEAVEISIAALQNEELFRIWQTLLENKYRLSVPYLARNVLIESEETLSEGERVQERTFKLAKIRG